MTAVDADPEPPRPQVSRMVLSYDTTRFPFAAVLRRDVFRVQHLERLHQYAASAARAAGGSGQLRSRDNLQARSLMQQLPDDSALLRVYHAFVTSVLAPLVGARISYSNRPKMRVHFPGTGSVSTMHSDVPVTKRSDQVNFWLPFTDVDGSAALWLESDYGRADYAPVPLHYGQALIFDGGYVSHGSVRNVSDVTRISMDMRFAYSGASTRADGVRLLNHLASRLDGPAPAASSAP